MGRIEIVTSKPRDPLKYSKKGLLTKLSEECHELGVEACKGIMGSVRRNNMEEEMAHVLLYIERVVERFGLNWDRILRIKDSKEKSKTL